MTDSLLIAFDFDAVDLYVDGDGPTNPRGHGDGLVLAGEGHTRYAYEAVGPHVSAYAADNCGRNAKLQLTLSSEAKLVAGKYVHLKLRVDLFLAEIVVTACTPLIEITFPLQCLGDIDACGPVWIERLGDSPQDTYPDDIKLTGLQITA